MVGGWIYETEDAPSLLFWCERLKIQIVLVYLCNKNHLWREIVNS